MLRVHSIETFGTQDGPGIRLVVFTQGCNFRCLYCHNPDTQAQTSQVAKSMESDEIVNLLERQRSYMKNGGGLTVSGGEPTLQIDGVIDLFEKAKVAGFHTCLDTNGSIVSPRLSELYQLTDLLLLDVKHFDSAMHQKLTGQPNDSVFKSAELRESMHLPMWLRYVLVPGWTDQEEHIKAWAHHFQEYQTVEKVEILPYHSMGVFKYEALHRPYYLEDVKSPTPELINQAKEWMATYIHAPISTS